MADKKDTDMDNFKSTADLTSNPGFQSSLSIVSKDDPISQKKYNPFEHRQVEHPTSSIGAMVHLFKACIGTGILAMPAAFKNSGLVAGSIGTLLTGVICTYTVAMVVRASQELCELTRTPSLGYADTCGAAFTHGPKSLRPWGTVVKNVVDWAMAITYFSVLTVYVVFIASSLKEVLDVYYPDYTFALPAYCALTMVPLVLISQIRNLKHLVPFSAIANFLILVVFAITMYFVFWDLPPVSDREMVASVTQWPLFFSTVVFAMEGIGAVMPIENEMKKPQQFLGCPGVLNITMFFVISFFGVFGFFGYLQYGDAVKGSITLNLPQTSILAQSAKLLMAVVIFFSYALQLYIVMEMINRQLLKRQSTSYENIIQVAIRTSVVISTVALAAAFPNLELVISLVGAVFLSTLGLLFPAIIDTVYRWDRGLGPFKYILWRNILISIISLAALVSGTYVSVANMIEELSGVKEQHVNETMTIL